MRVSISESLPKQKENHPTPSEAKGWFSQINLSTCTAEATRREVSASLFYYLYSIYLKNMQKSMYLFLMFFFKQINQ